MFTTSRKACGVIALFLMALHAGCVAAPPPSVESCRLTATDLEVLRIGLSSIIQPLVAGSHPRVIVLTASTLMFPVWHPPLAPFSPPPDPFPFAGWGVQVAPPSQPLPLHVLYGLDERLSPLERAAWERRNRVTREIPGLAIARLGNHQGADDVPPGWTVAAVSAPVYPTSDTAVLYAEYTCRGGCGEGQLIHLARLGGSWRIEASEQLWIG